MHEGWIAQIGTPTDIYESPNSRMIAEFIGSVNLFEGEIVSDEVDHCIIDSPEVAQQLYIGHGVATNVEDNRVWLALRPEKALVSRDKPEDSYNWSKGIVHDIAYLGGNSIYYVRLPSQKVVMCSIANISRRQDKPTWDDEVYISWEAASGVVLRS
ncbi:TOBE domain-containing protein [Veronia nyctiphanis]|uniref:TOBE domain-containing protein n=1 Tax=Veronia nyctiphanis TaxID=1278244 RepID=UPI0038B515AC